MKYKKKPVEVEVEQLKYLDGNSILKCMIFMGTTKPLNGYDALYFDDYVEIVRKEGGLKIETLEGTMLASEGDYIIKGVNGEFYPCKPDIFEKTYELISE